MLALGVEPSTLLDTPLQLLKEPTDEAAQVGSTCREAGSEAACRRGKTSIRGRTAVCVATRFALPLAQLRSVLAHELCHVVMAAANVPVHHLQPTVVEGIAELWSHVYLEAVIARRGDDAVLAARALVRLRNNRVPVYRQGLKAGLQALRRYSRGSLPREDSQHSAPSALSLIMRAVQSQDSTPW